MIDTILFAYVVIGALYAIWFVIRYCPLLKKWEQVTLTGITFTLWPVVWGGVAWDRAKIWLSTGRGRRGLRR